MFDKLVKLSKQLYPTGRAFRMFVGSEFEKLNNGIALSEERYYLDSYTTLNSILPDNANFTNLDATDWERRLGIPNGSLNSLATRKTTILRKMQAPGINPAKGHYLNLERELQLAGFNVFVYENIPANPPSFFPASITMNSNIQYGQKQYGGATQYGAVFTNKIANHIEEDKDLYYGLGGSYKSTFFIGGHPGNGWVADVPVTRKKEFRELILKIKQVQSIGFLFINYTP